jgi:hypothetical protein
MVGGVVYAITPAKAPKVKLGAVARDGTVHEHAPAGGKTGKSRNSGSVPKSNRQSLKRRLEERWDRRRNDQQ